MNNQKAVKMNLMLKANFAYQLIITFCVPSSFTSNFSSSFSSIIWHWKVCREHLLVVFLLLHCCFKTTLLILLKVVLFTAHWRCGKSRSPQIVLSKSNTSFQTWITDQCFDLQAVLLTGETFLLELWNDFFKITSSTNSSPNPLRELGFSNNVNEHDSTLHFLHIADFRLISAKIVKSWSLLPEALTISLFLDSPYSWLTNFL